MVYQFLCEPVFSFPLGMYVGVELLGPVVILCLTFGDVYNLVACTHLLPRTRYSVEVACDSWGAAWFMPCLHSSLAGDLGHGTSFLRWACGMWCRFNVDRHKELLTQITQ